MPGANARALDKARVLDCDTVIFDLEDAVAPEAKAGARERVAQAVAGGGYGHRELIVRANALDTAWGARDVEAIAPLPVAGLLFPKVETVDQVNAIVAIVDASGGTDVPVWLMIETPRAILDLEALADASPRIEALVLGTSDLVMELRGRHTASRASLAYALQRAVLVARTFGVEIFDGVHLDFRNLDTFRDACEQARAIGFDGKTLIHPDQIAIANEVFGHDADAVAHARKVLEVWQAALAAGKGVAVLDGRLIENLHAAEAQRVIAFADALATRG
jgi:citrate lyase subunit beta/citryl-CoA lyase